MAARDPYRVLGVGSDADQETITAAYRALSQQVHPDRTIGLPERERQQATDQMVALNQAYEQIGTALARRVHDLQSSRMSGSVAPVRYGGPPTARGGWFARWWRRVAAMLGIVFILGQMTYRLLIPSTPNRTTTAPATFVGTLAPAPIPAATLAPVVAAPASVAPSTVAPSTVAPSTTAAPGCWFIQLASTTDPNSGVAWAKPAVAVESPQLPMFFVSFEEWPEALPVGTVLAGTVATTEQGSLQVLIKLQALGVTDATIRPMLIDVCRKLIPFL